MSAERINKVETGRYRIERVPPEGGWGYMVVPALGISLGCCWGSYSCFSLMFNDFIESVDGGTSSFTIVMGFVNVALSVSALFTGTLSRKISVRVTAILGATLIFLSNLISLFATSVLHLIFSYGIFLGAGMGFMLPAAFAIFNGYFVKKRILMMSITQSFNGAMLISFLLNEYGYRGAIAIIGAINGHAVLGMIIMQPAEWHQKIVTVLDEETNPFLNSDGHDNEVKVNIHVNKNENENEQNRSVKPQLKVISEVPSGTELSKEFKSEIESELDDDTKSVRSGKREYHGSARSLSEFTERQRRFSIASVMSLGNSPIVLNTPGVWQKVVDFLDLTHLKDIVYVNIVLGLTFAHFADGYFFILEPVHLYNLNISKDDTALIMSLTALFDLISRIVVSVICVFITFKARHLYTFGTVACIISRFVFLEVYDFMGLSIVSSIMGFLKTLVFLPTPLVLAEYLSKRRFTSGYGLYLFIQRVLSFLLSPIIGWIRDITQSYEICFHALTFIMALCAVPWIIELVWFHFYPRKFITSAEQLNLDPKNQKQ